MELQSDSSALPLVTTVFVIYNTELMQTLCKQTVNLNFLGMAIFLIMNIINVF